MLATRWVALTVILMAYFRPFQEFFSLDGLLYIGQQWSWLAAFFITIAMFVSIAWILAWSVGRLLVTYKLGRYRLKTPGL